MSMSTTHVDQYENRDQYEGIGVNGVGIFIAITINRDVDSCMIGDRFDRAPNISGRTSDLVRPISIPAMESHESTPYAFTDTHKSYVNRGESQIVVFVPRKFTSLQFMSYRYLRLLHSVYLCNFRMSPARRHFHHLLPTNPRASRSQYLKGK
jgi:hypothetical protein